MQIKVTPLRNRRPLHTAPLGLFRQAAPKLLSGEYKAQIGNLERSIAVNGLIRPLRVIPQNGRLVVVDGAKRLAALRKLAFAGALPKRLQVIPYVRLDQPLECKAAAISPAVPRPALVPTVLRKRA